MSWAEVTKINSNISEPLNYLMWVQDLSIYGTKGYVYKDVNKLIELSAKSPSAVANDIAVVFLLEGVIQNGSHIGEYFKKIIPNTGTVFDNLNTMTAVANSSTAMTAVANSSTAMTAVINSSTAMTAVANSSTAMTAVINSSTALTAVINSSTALTAVINSSTAMTAVANSSTAMTAVINSSTAMTAVANSSTAMTAIESSAIAINTLASSSLKQTLNVASTNAWTTRRSGKVWIIGQRQSWSANVGQTIQLRYTLVGNTTHTNTTPETYNKYAPVNKFFDSITNYSSAGSISCSYEFTPID